MIKTTYIQPKKVAYVRPCIKGIALVAEQHLVAYTTLEAGEGESPDDAEAKEEKNVWDKVWDREPVFGTN